MNKKKAKIPAVNGKKSSNVFPAQVGFQGLRMPGLKFPLENESPIIIENEVQNALFQRCLELYRLTDLLRRQGPGLIEAYSRFNSRHQFGEALQARFFDWDERWSAQMDPEIVVRLTVLSNLLYELKVSLSCTDALPHSLRTEIEKVLMLLIEGWDGIRIWVYEKYGWSFAVIEAPVVSL